MTTRMLPVPPPVVMVIMTMMVMGAWKRRSNQGPWVTMRLHEMSAVVKEVHLRQVLPLRLPMQTL